MKSLAILQEEGSLRRQQAACSPSESSELEWSSSGTSLHLPSFRIWARLAFWLAGLSLVAGLLYLCLRYWHVAVVTVALAIGLFLLLCFVDDHGPKKEQPRPK